jgi:tetratricopeptide (TPR) repeat protein
MQVRPLIIVLAAGVAISALSLVGASVASAAGTSPSPTPSTPSTAPVPQQCQNLQRGTRKFRNCVKKYSALFNDEELYAAAFGFSQEDGAYNDALEVLRAIRKQDDPRVLTLTGFALRKTGQLDAAFVHYGRALALDANNVQTREYLGEAHLQKGDLAAARGQLVEIAQRCGETCESYVMLDQTIKAFEAKSL